MKRSLAAAFALMVLFSVNLVAQMPVFRWAKNAGGVTNDYGTDIAVDASGNSYVTGYFQSATMSFGSTVVSNANATFADMYIVKYDAGGNVVWARKAGNTSNDYVNGATSTTPQAYALKQNYPNPFNPVTTIAYALPVSEHVRLAVYNMLGQEVATLVDEVEGAGHKTISFDASGLPSGMYTYRITDGTFIDERNLMLVK